MKDMETEDFTTASVDALVKFFDWLNKKENKLANLWSKFMTSKGL